MANDDSKIGVLPARTLPSVVACFASGVLIPIGGGFLCGITLYEWLKFSFEMSIAAWFAFAVFAFWFSRWPRYRLSWKSCLAWCFWVSVYMSLAPLAFFGTFLLMRQLAWGLSIPVASLACVFGGMTGSAYLRDYVDDPVEPTEPDETIVRGVARGNLLAKLERDHALAEERRRQTRD